MVAVCAAKASSRGPWPSLAPAIALAAALSGLVRGQDGFCAESPVNWTAVREDMVTYTTLSEPRHRSRRCFGLDRGVWSYCGIAAMHLLQMQGNLLNVPTKDDGRPLELWEVPVSQRNPCPLGTVAVNLYAMIFLTREERLGMLFHIGSQLDSLRMSFEDLLSTRWPLFGILSRLSEDIINTGLARQVDRCGRGAGGAASEVDLLLPQLAQTVTQRRLVPDALARRLSDAVGRVAPLVLQYDARAEPGCALAFATASAALAVSARLRGDAETASRQLRSAEAALRSISTNYTHLDWLSSEWPVFKLLHRAQFNLISLGDVSFPGVDVVPMEPKTGRPMRFAFNRGFARPDVLYIDIAADIIHTDLMRTLPALFGMKEATPREGWSVNLVYTSNDYHDLIPFPGLFRLRATSQKLVYLPMGHDLVGEKDMQCKVYQNALSRWTMRRSVEDAIGGMPRCFELPDHREELRAYAARLRTQADADAAGGNTAGSRAAFVRKNEGGWGGRGVDIRFGVEDLLGEGFGSAECAFSPLEDVQCLGLRAAASPEASGSEDACRSACCAEEEAGLGPCEAWNWREGEGCWVGTPRVCSDRNAMYLGGWRGGQRLRGRAAEPRAVVQRYILDPVLYQLEGISPPVRIKTDIRVYGAAVSLDPLRLYVSKYGYFRTGYLERNYSTASEDDFLERLMHITHHIPKIEAGTYHCPTGPSAGDPRGSEFDAGSGGSLHKWFRIAEEQNGLDRKKLWETIKTVVALFILSVRSAVSCRENPLHHACGAVGFHFFADLVVDSSGRAWLMEIHPTLAIKSHGLGDPEGGWVEVLTRSTRQGSHGTMAMFWAGWMNVPYRRWAEALVRRRLLAQPRWRPELRRLRRLLRWQREMRPGWGGEEDTVEGLLSKALVEEHMACRMAVEPLLPAMWRRVGRYVNRGPAGDPFGDGLRPLYRLYDAARRLVATRGAPGDLRPSRCHPIDFNEGTVWDQPWERETRRFK